MLRATLLFFLASLSIACEDPPPPAYALDELSAVHDAAGRIEVRGVLRNLGGPQPSTVCVHVECLETVVVPAENDDDEDPEGENAGGKLVSKLVDAQERCYADGIDEGDAVSFAITMGKGTSALSNPQINVELSFLEGSGPTNATPVDVIR